MRIDIRTIFIPQLPSNHVLLLRRSPAKTLFPNLITGIGGKVELTAGEGEDLAAAGLREWQEEVPQLKDSLQDLRLRLVTHDTRGDDIYLLLWFTAKLAELPTDLSCSEGQLLILKSNQLPLEEMVPTARQAIPSVLNLADDDQHIYDGVFSTSLEELTVSPASRQFSVTP